MTNIEVLNWCKSNKYIHHPEKLAALLYIFVPEKEDLEEWEISDEDNSIFCINDTYYKVRILPDIVEELNYYRQSIIQDSLEEIPEQYQKYIDWDAFFIDNPITINMFINGLEHTVFNGIDYYIEQYGD